MFKKIIEEFEQMLKEYYELIYGNLKPEGI